MGKLFDLVIPPWVRAVAIGVAVLALVSAVAFGLWYAYDVGRTGERAKITSEINQKTVEKTRESVQIRNKAAARAAADDDDAAFDRMRPAARHRGER